jgi:4-hydroxy-tetrahydrodipicolinate reductase
MKIALLGYGKMGQLIGQMAEARGHQIVLVIGAENSNDLTIDALQKADIAIEFSAPDAAAHHIQLCLEAGVPVVVGTTGWYESFNDLANLAASKQGAMLTATNFSLGVNLFFALSSWIGSVMTQHDAYQVRVDETHHVHKKDAPSGTAITIAERLLEHLKLKDWSLDGANPQSLPIYAHRIDEVPGTHEVRFSSAEDDIILSHVAHNRNGFANGAVMAAEWLHGKTGVFTMKDVLGI